MNLLLNLPKSQYSESVVRKALYWLSETCQWELEESNTEWNIYYQAKEGNRVGCEQEINRLLNDFILREKLDQKTKFYREKIILSALQKIGGIEFGD